MDTNLAKPCELDNLVIIYFGQDCEVIDKECDFDNLLNDYLNRSSAFSLRVLLANLTELHDQADRCQVFLSRYEGEFAPERWDLTAQAWLDIVKQRLVAYMNEKDYSTALSRF